MTNKNFNWHKAWSRDAAGHLLHTSGLRILVTENDGFADLETDDTSLVVFQASEMSRGVPKHQFLERIERLLKEAEKWHLSNS